MSIGRFATFLTHYLRARLFANLSGEALREYQDRRAGRVIAHAIEHSPFYRRRFSGLRLENWRDFPPIIKTEMMTEFDDFTTCGVRLEEAMSLALASETSVSMWRSHVGSLRWGQIFVFHAKDQATEAASLTAPPLHPTSRPSVAEPAAFALGGWTLQVFAPSMVRPNALDSQPGVSA